jgi:hypothetical protein
MQNFTIFSLQMKLRRTYARFLLAVFISSGLLLALSTLTGLSAYAYQVEQFNHAQPDCMIAQKASMSTSLRAINVELSPDSTTSYILSITNTGEVPLAWNLIDLSDVSWLTIFTQTAFLPIWTNPSEHHEMSIQVGPYSVPGTYTTELAVEIVGETILLQEVVIPVTLTVKPRQIFMPFFVRDYPPIPRVQNFQVQDTQEEHAYTYNLGVKVTIDATIENDVIESIELSNDGNSWISHNWETPSGSDAMSIDWELEDTTSGLQTVYARVKGHKGGVVTVMDDVLLFQNGDFSQALDVGWQKSGNLPVSIENQKGLLGPGGPGRDATSGYASVHQDVDIPDKAPLLLAFTYHIYTYDRNIGLTDSYDRFDVLIDGQLVHKDANQDTFDGTLQDLGVVEMTVPIPSSVSGLVPIEFRVTNVPDELYKTYVYLDDVHLEFVP